MTTTASRSPTLGAAFEIPAFRGTLAGTNVAVGVIPEVNGASATAVTPEKAGAWTLAVGLG